MAVLLVEWRILIVVDEDYHPAAAIRNKRGTKRGDTIRGSQPSGGIR
jgi:hypothetical protein